MVEIPQDKIDAVCQYLKDEFPNCSVTHTYAFDYVAESFTVIWGEELYILTISQAFLSDRTPKQISLWLKENDRDLARQFPGKSDHRFLVSTEGIISVSKAT